IRARRQRFAWTAPTRRARAAAPRAGRDLRVLDPHGLEALELLLQLDAGPGRPRMGAWHRQAEAIEHRAELHGRHVVVPVRRLDFPVAYRGALRENALVVTRHLIADGVPLEANLLCPAGRLRLSDDIAEARGRDGRGAARGDVDHEVAAAATCRAWIVDHEVLLLIVLYLATEGRYQVAHVDGGHHARHAIAASDDRTTFTTADHRSPAACERLRPVDR